MITAPIPADEQERLAELHATNLLDTPAEARFDRLVELAMDIFDVPMTYIALVDADRQWFKAKCGLTSEQTGRDESFCGHTILRREPLIVPDALNDERFFDNPLVLGDPGVRFYAGYPLAGQSGHNIATLCLADVQPRELSDRQLETFGKLARIAEHELNLVNLVRTQRELLHTKQQLAETQAKLNRELQEAAAFVESMLPEPLNDDQLSSGYRFIASSQLGGDTFGHFYLDDARTRLAVYLLDVTGHGVGSSLLSVTVGSVLQRRTLAGADFNDPACVLAALNDAFPMEKNQNKFFTIWYGVYDTPTRTLTWSSAGHHPAVLFPPKSSEPVQLGEPALMIGAVPDAEYANESRRIDAGSLMHLFSDGAFEVVDKNGQMLRLAGLHQLLSDVRASVTTNGSTPKPAIHNERLDLIVHRIRRQQGSFNFPDDFSMLEMAFH